MAIRFRGVTSTPLTDLTLSAPDRSIIGVIGLKGSGQAAVLRLAAGLETPVAGSVEAPPDRRLIQAGELLNLSPVDILCLDSALANQDPLVRGRAIVGLDRLRRSGATILIASHDEALLTRLSDEIWWLDGGRIAATGDPRDVFPKYGAFVAGQLVEWGRTLTEPVDFSRRRGDGRAEVVSIETAPAGGAVSLVLRSHEPAVIRVGVRFLAAVEDPVIGIMIRTRVGLEVYGTNTELEGAGIGQCAAGEVVSLEFRFCCDLCPGEYTVTAASHDADGVAHDWLDDAVAFSVAADRYTAGVADLRAAVSVGRSG